MFKVGEIVKVARFRRSAHGKLYLGQTGVIQAIYTCDRFGGGYVSLDLEVKKRGIWFDEIEKYTKKYNLFGEMI